MRLRIERSGYHWFDRRTGIHVLVDEIRPRDDIVSGAPRTLSIALSNVCDLRCPFCYRPKNNARLEPEFVKGIARVADVLGCLEITLGGGEPLLYPNIGALCQWIWANTDLGISITTHGHRLVEPLSSELAGHVSSMRFSIDGGEPYYGQIRGRALEELLRNIRTIRGRIPFGVNTVASPGRLGETRRAADLAIAIGAENLLVIPEHLQGRCVLAERDWELLDDIVAEYEGRLRLLVTASAVDRLHQNVLITECDDEFVFAHVSADRKLKASSYVDDGIAIRDAERLGDYLAQLREIATAVA